MPFTMTCNCCGETFSTLAAPDSDMIPCEFCGRPICGEATDSEIYAFERGRIQGARSVGYAMLDHSDWAAGGWHVHIGFGPQDKASVMMITAAYNAITYSLYF